MNRIMNIKSDFGVYDQNPNLVYLDSASTTLVPKISTLETANFLDTVVASARRGAHKLAIRGSETVENVRKSIAEFLRTDSSSISFQKSISSAVASLVYGYNWKQSGKKKIVLSQNEENSVFVSALRAAEVLDLDVELIALEKDGSLSLNSLEQKVDDETGIVAVGHVLPGIGIRNPLKEVEAIVHNHNALLLTDITRSIGITNESPLDYRSDVFLFSANIGLMGPPGLAIQWISPSADINHIPGILGGFSVFDLNGKKYEIAFQPDKYESDYVNVPAIVGLGKSIEYLTTLHGLGLLEHLGVLSRYMKKRLSEIDNLILYGNYDDSTTIFGFNLNGSSEVSCHDIALFLDESNISVRSGLICAHPLVHYITHEGLIQASLHGYNSLEDVDRLADTLIVINEQLM